MLHNSFAHVLRKKKRTGEQTTDPLIRKNEFYFGLFNVKTPAYLLSKI